MTQAQIPENDKHCELWCEVFEGDGVEGHRIEEIHIIAKGESQLNLRTHPSPTACAKVYTRLLSSSPVGINNVIKKSGGAV